MTATHTPGTIQAIWHNTLQALRAASQGQAAGLWVQTHPIERTPETFSVSAPTDWVAGELRKPRLAPLISGALARSIGHPVRLCVEVRAAPAAADDEDDPVIAEMLRRIAAKHKGLVPPGYDPLDGTPPAS